MEPPKHRFEVDIRIEANDEDTVACALHEMAIAWDRRKQTDSHTVGGGSNWSVRITKNEGVTPESHRVALKEWAGRDRI